MNRPKEITKKFLIDHLSIGYGTEWSFTINPYFLDKTKAWDNVEEIKDLYKKKFLLFNKMVQTENKEDLKKMAKEVEDTELEIQELFNFPKSRDHFRFWEMPKCECPVMDNQERWGTPYAVYTESCPIHGEGE